MNVGLYSFKNMTARQIEPLSKEIQERFSTENIYVYSENTQKQRMSRREELRRIMQDYNEGKVNIVVFEKLSALGSDDYIKGKVLELLINNKVEFFIIQENIDSTTNLGKQKIQMLIFIGEKLKEINKQRDQSSNIVNNGRKNTFLYQRVGNQNQLI